MLNSIVLTIRGSVTVGLYILYALSIVSFIYARYFNIINAFTATGAWYYLKLITLSGIFIYLGLIAFILSQSVTNVSYNEDVVIVLGAGVHNNKVSATLKNRLDAAVIYYQKNPNVYIVVTGGLTRQKDTTEAAAMSDYLISVGIPENKILQENKSQSTKENYLFSKKLLLDKNIPHDKIVFITNSFHLYRAKTYAEYGGFTNAVGIGTKTDPFVFIPAVLREVLGVIDMWLFKLK